MSPGDLVRYTPPLRRVDEPASYIGLVLENVGGAWLRIFWSDVGRIDEFNIGDKKFWEVIS